MTDTKVVIIGAGSTVFTPGLIADLVNSPHLRDATVALVDVKPEAVATMCRFAERVARERGVGLRVEGATDRRQVLPGADLRHDDDRGRRGGGLGAGRADPGAPRRLPDRRRQRRSGGSLPGAAPRAGAGRHRPRHGGAVPGGLALQLHQPALGPRPRRPQDERGPLRRSLPRHPPHSRADRPRSRRAGGGAERRRRRGQPPLLVPRRAPSGGERLPALPGVHPRGAAIAFS